MSTLYCKKCNRDLPLIAEFWVLSKYERCGFRTWACRACIYEYNRKVAAKPEVKRKKAAYHKAHPRPQEVKNRVNREYRQRYPERNRAHQVVRTAKRRGDLIPQPCSKCGRTRAQAHHYDYSKPLDVVWLCHWCHTEEHHKKEAA